MRVRPALLALVLLGGCAPSQAHLLRHRHYPEALAGVNDGALDGGAVLAAIADDLAVGLHVEAVSAARLREQLPGHPSGFDDLALVRVVHSSHALTLDRCDVTVSLVRDGVEVPEVDTSLPALAARASEALPEPETIEHAASHDLRLVQRTRFPLAELLGRLTVNIVTVGLIHEAIPIVEDRGSPGYTEVRQPDADDYARASPAAASVHEWLAYPGCWDAGQRCEAWQLWPREQANVGSQALEVTVAVGREGSLRYRIELPPGSLEQGLAAVFGARERPLAELAPVELEYALIPEFDGTRLERDDRRRLCARVRGRRGQPGLAEQPGVRVTIESVAGDAEVAARVAELRQTLLECGLPESRLEVVEGEPFYWPSLRVRQPPSG